MGRPDYQGLRKIEFEDRSDTDMLEFSDVGATFITSILPVGGCKFRIRSMTGQASTTKFQIGCASVLGTTPITPDWITYGGGCGNIENSANGAISSLMRVIYKQLNKTYLTSAMVTEATTGMTMSGALTTVTDDDAATFRKGYVDTGTGTWTITITRSWLQREIFWLFYKLGSAGGLVTTLTILDDTDAVLFSQTANTTVTSLQYVSVQLPRNTTTIRVKFVGADANDINQALWVYEMDYLAIGDQI